MGLKVVHDNREKNKVRESIEVLIWDLVESKGIDLINDQDGWADDIQETLDQIMIFLYGDH